MDGFLKDLKSKATVPTAVNLFHRILGFSGEWPIQFHCFVCAEDVNDGLKHLTEVHTFCREIAEIVIGAKDHIDAQKKFAERYDRCSKLESIQDWDEKIKIKQAIVEKKLARVKQLIDKINELHVITKKSLKATKLLQIADKLSKFGNSSEREETAQYVEILKKMASEVTNTASTNQDPIETTERTEIVWLIRQTEKFLRQNVIIKQHLAKHAKIMKEVKRCPKHLKKNMLLLRRADKLIKRSGDMMDEMKKISKEIQKPYDGFRKNVQKMDKELKKAKFELAEVSEDYIKTIYWFYCLRKQNSSRE